MSAWKRHEFGWLRADGEVWLERGAPMSDTGKPCWIVWLKAADGQVEEHSPTVATTKDGSGARRLSDLFLEDFEPGRPDPWFIHVGDEGWFSDARIAAEHHVAQRDAKAGAA